MINMTLQLDGIKNTRFFSRLLLFVLAQIIIVKKMRTAINICSFAKKTYRGFGHFLKVQKININI